MNWDDVINLYRQMNDKDNDNPIIEIKYCDTKRDKDKWTILRKGISSLK